MLGSFLTWRLRIPILSVASSQTTRPLDPRWPGSKRTFHLHILSPDKLARKHSEWTQVGLGSWIRKLDSEVGFGSWTRKLDSEVGFGSWIRKLDSEVGFGSWIRKLASEVGFGMDSSFQTGVVSSMYRWPRTSVLNANFNRNTLLTQQLDTMMACSVVVVWWSCKSGTNSHTSCSFDEIINTTTGGACRADRCVFTTQATCPVSTTDANGTKHKPHKRGDGLTVHMKVGGMPLAVPNVVAGRA